MPDATLPNEQEREWARDVWSSYLHGGGEGMQTDWRMRLMKRLPSDPRCKVCGAPFRGMGRPILPLLGVRNVRPSGMNPTLCNRCEVMVKAHEVGVEVELTLLFADVRGSTALAERVGATEFQRVIDRFYRAAAEIVVHTGGLLDKLVGDEVIGVYVPGIAGAQHSQRALDAARELLRATGHGSETGAWLPIGVGVHAGTAWVGAVGSHDGVSQLTVLGDTANTAARLASAAGAGEILISTEAYERGGIDASEHETRTLELRGRQQPVTVTVLHG